MGTGKSGRNKEPSLGQVARIIQLCVLAPHAPCSSTPEGSLPACRYGGGVWEASRCPLPGGAPTMAGAAMNHAVLVVGYDASASPPYW